MKSTIAVLAILAIVYFTMSYTTIIHAELEAANSKIYLLELEILDTKITSKIRLNKIIEQAKFIAWNKKHNQ